MQVRQACIDLALTDAYGEDEQAVAWPTCIEEMFGRFKLVQLMGNEVALVGFDLSDHAVVAVSRQGKRKAASPSTRSSSLILRRSSNAG